MIARERAGRVARSGHLRPAALACLAGALLAGWGAVGPLGAEALRRYSGRVTEVDLVQGLVVVEELGRRGLAVRHAVRVEADTPLVSTSRLRPRDMRGSGAFAEVPVSLADVLPGDFVVVEAVELGGHSVARRVTIVETDRRP